MEPYYQDGTVVLYHGDIRDVLPTLGQFDACVTDPPYGETSLGWDRWPDGWPALVAAHTSSLWCFGSMRMFLDRRDEFSGWRFSQDVVWEKHNGSGFAADRFRRVHEVVAHFYRGNWANIHHETPRVPAVFRRGGRRSVERAPTRRQHTGVIGANCYSDDGLRLVRSVLREPSVRKGLHPTEKPVAILLPLIEYAVPPGGVVLEPFAGSGSALHAARVAGRRAVGVEASEEYCEKAAARLDAAQVMAIASLSGLPFDETTEGDRDV